MNRREFIVGSTAAVLVAAAGGSYVFSTCPLDTEGTGICTGPCSAFIDLDGDGHCDRLAPPVVTGVTGEIAQVGEASLALQRVCPYGLVDDPYPGECNLYIDADGDGICDLSQERSVPRDATSADAQEEPDASGPPAAETEPAAATILTACPLGLVNDPFPGECRRYVDDNQNGLCDLSEPALIASGEIAVLPDPTALPTPAPGVTPPPRPVTACPYGLVNDPYPGECRKYVDQNGNGICDLSEPDLVVSGEVAIPSSSTATHSGDGGSQQRRRGQGKN